MEQPPSPSNTIRPTSAAGIGAGALGGNTMPKPFVLNPYEPLIERAEKLRSFPAAAAVDCTDTAAKNPSATSNPAATSHLTLSMISPPLSRLDVSRAYFARVPSVSRL